jgi:hypothetical protein
MSQTTGRLRDCKDQFYTRPDIAKTCVDTLRMHVAESAVWIEPSAGNGAFLSLVDSARGYDIDPKHPRIQQADFLTVDIPDGCIVFGNPPFGRQSSLAKQFIRHAATRAAWIAFILPRSFTKPSMQKAFPLCFHLVEELALPDNAFLVNEKPYDVPCVFQVWTRRDSLRNVQDSQVPNGFTFVKKSDGYTFAFRRVGGNAGKCCLPSDSLSVQSHYFVRVEDTSLADAVVAESLTYTFPSNTTGPRSLSKGEATLFLNASIAHARAAKEGRGNEDATQQRL